MSATATARFKLVTCELHNPCFHGQTETNSPGISGHFLCFYVVSSREPFDPFSYPFVFMLRVPICRSVWRLEDTAYWKQTQNGATLAPDVAEAMRTYGHPTIRNYRNIVERVGMRTLEIAELVTLSYGDECVCVLKTVWLRIFQRHVKKWIQNKKRVANLLKETRFLMLRECGKYKNIKT